MNIMIKYRTWDPRDVVGFGQEVLHCLTAHVICGGVITIRPQSYRAVAGFGPILGS